MEKFEKKYDIKSELGYINEYDATAQKGLKFAEKHGDSRLRAEAKKLAELIHNIPYNNDRFYKVINQKDRVAQIINNYKGEANIDNKLVVETGHPIWRFYEVAKNKEKPGAWLTSISFYRLNQDIKAEIPDKVKRMIDSRDYELTDRDKVDLGAGSYREYFIYENKKYENKKEDNLRIYLDYNYHENQKDYGLSITVDGFKDKDSAESFFDFDLSKGKVWLKK